MKRLVAVLFLTPVLLTGCFSAKKAATEVQNKIKEKGACLILVSLRKNYTDALNGSALSGQAANDYRNALEALKPIVPEDVQQAATTLRATETPVDPDHYNPTQKAARQTLDNYFQQKCGDTLTTVDK